MSSRDNIIVKYEKKFGNKLSGEVDNLIGLGREQEIKSFTGVLENKALPNNTFNDWSYTWRRFVTTIHFPVTFLNRETPLDEICSTTYK